MERLRHLRRGAVGLRYRAGIPARQRMPSCWSTRFFLLPELNRRRQLSMQVGQVRGRYRLINEAPLVHLRAVTWRTQHTIRGGTRERPPQADTRSHVRHLSRRFFYRQRHLIAQNAAGGNTGADCADAHAVSWFNTSSNWGSAPD